MIETVRQPAPQKAVRVKRLTPALKSLPIDPDNAVKTDFNTARCLQSFASYHGWDIVQRKDGEHIITWRIG